MSPIDLNDPTAVLLAVVDALRRAGIESAAYGGLALAAYGEPRETKDADLAITGVPGVAAADALDFVIFKALSTRERDLEDAASVMRQLRDRLEMTAIESEVARLASEIPDHDVSGRFTRIQELASH